MANKETLCGYVAVAKDLFNGLDEPKQGFEWVAMRLAEIADEKGLGYDEMMRWLRLQDCEDSTVIFDEIFG